MIRIEAIPSFLRFRYPFRIAHGERLGTDVVLVRLTMNDAVGYGEATLPPYLGITVQDVLQALSRRGLEAALSLSNPADWHESLRSIIPDVMPALAALDMARWSVHLQSEGKTLAKLLGEQEANVNVPHTYTLGISSFNEMEEKMSFAIKHGFDMFKLKLDGKNDEQMLSNFRRLSKSPFAVDANQSWPSMEHARLLVDLLEKENCVLIEQPFVRTDRLMTKQLADCTDLPIIADEACQTTSDLEEVLSAFDGVNVKLQKCGGITPAIQQLRVLRRFEKMALIGCMSESSIGCAAAEQLTFLCNWADLDGPYLNSNNREICESVGYSL